jgi:sigma-E factor negative regulatory protein RseA
MYHCIGDVLRSDELACQRAGFQTRFAALLEAEPHVFAPRAASDNGARSGRRRWQKPASLAASVAAVAVVAGLLMQQRGGGDTQTAAVMPAAQMAIAPQPAVLMVPSAYLAAHREYASGLAMQGMAAHIRTVAHDSDK